MMPSDNATGAWVTPMETRKVRAEYYFQTVLAGQREWYSKNAERSKRRHVVLAILVIVRGADLRLAGAGYAGLDPLHAKSMRRKKR